jgi:hypothetical protein
MGYQREWLGAAKLTIYVVIELAMIRFVFGWLCSTTVAPLHLVTQSFIQLYYQSVGGRDVRTTI